jgi:hypothetical protein
MRKFTKIVTKDIENIYKEFEGLFIDCIHNAECSCYDNEFKKITELTVFQIIRDNHFLDREFEKVINSLKNHLIEQLKLFEPFPFISFIEKQDENYINYLPDARKEVNYKNYLLWIVGKGDESILNENFKPSEEHIEYLKYIFGIYQIYYEKLKIESGLLFEKYKNIIGKNYTEGTDKVVKIDFESIFNPQNNAYQVCIELLEDLQITINGVSKMTEGRMGLLSGAIIAMKEKKGRFFKQDFTDMELLNYFNAHLNTNYKALNKRSNAFDESKGHSKNFIENYTK